jgi:hypothetical protein
MNIDKSKLLDTNGNPLTQSLFLEMCYNDYAVYTMKDEDHELNGKFYPSIKKLYLEMEDPTEYDFSCKYLLGWQHWKRLCENKKIREHIDQWREELELKLRSRAVRDIMNLCANENGNFQAAKYLADRGWDKRQAGRPSKAEVEKRAAIEAHIDAEFAGDVKRLSDYRKPA